MGLGDRQQPLGGAADVVVGGGGFDPVGVGGAFQAKLQAGNVARAECFFERAGEGVELVTVEVGRADQVEAAAGIVPVRAARVGCPGDQNLPW